MTRSLINSDETYNLTTAKAAFNKSLLATCEVRQGYGIADEAIAAYLNLPGKTARTLWATCQAAGSPRWRMSIRPVLRLGDPALRQQRRGA